MMGQGRFINFNKCTILVEDIDKGGGCMCRRQWPMGKCCNSKFYYELKTSPKFVLKIKLKEKKRLILGVTSVNNWLA